MQLTNTISGYREPKAARGVAYSYANRKDGWYCFPFDEDGNQLGDASYAFHMRAIKAIAANMAVDLGVKVERW